MNLNWTSIYEALPFYQKAGILTLRLAFWGILFATVIGIICSIIQYFQWPLLSNIIQGYIEVSRNTPLLIQLYFLYYGLPKIGLTFSNLTCGIIGLTFLGGSYMSEAFRSGLEAVSKTQIDAGLALGLTPYQLTRFVLLPQSLPVSIPAFGANCIFLLKETSIFSGIAILELMNTTRDLIGMYYRTNEYLLLLVISYGIILIPISLFFSWLERKVRHGAFGN